MSLINLYAHITLNGNTQFVYSDPAVVYGEEEGLIIHLSPMRMGKLNRRDALKQVKEKYLCLL